MPHDNARTNRWARREMVRRVEQEGWPPSEVAMQFGVSRATVYKWLRRWREEGLAGLEDRSSRPRRCPGRTSAVLETRIVALRTRRRLGPARIAPLVGVPPSTVHRVLVRHGLNRLRYLDRPTGRRTRRFEAARPGQLVHLDTKRLAKVPRGGGHRMLGRTFEVEKRSRRQHPGYEHVHAAVDDHTRLAYVEIHDDATAPTCTAFLTRAVAWFGDHGITVEAVMTDNALAYTNAKIFRETLHDLQLRHVRIPRRRPQVNGKVERFNRTLADEWAYARLFRSNHGRRRALERWLHDYNYHRTHTAIGRVPPIERVNNLTGYNS